MRADHEVGDIILMSESFGVPLPIALVGGGSNIKCLGAIGFALSDIEYGSSTATSKSISAPAGTMFGYIHVSTVNSNGRVYKCEGIVSADGGTNNLIFWHTNPGTGTNYSYIMTVTLTTSKVTLLISTSIGSVSVKYGCTILFYGE